MSTVNNNSPGFRRRSNISSSSNPSPSKVITSKKPESDLPRSPKKPVLPRRQIRPWFQRCVIEEIYSLWNVTVIRNAVLFAGVTWLVISIIPWSTAPFAEMIHPLKGEAHWRSKMSEAYGDLEKPLVYSEIETDDIVYEREKKPTPILKSEDLIWVKFRSNEISIGEFKSPVLRLSDLNTVYYFDALQVAYADVRYTINKLTENIPGISEHGPSLTSGIKKFRDNAWKLSEAIGGYRKSTYQVPGRLKERCTVLRKELIKVKPKDKWILSYQSNSPTGKRIAELWLYFFETLGNEVKDIHAKTYEFHMEVAEAIQERRDLQNNLRELEPRMIKEAQKREWDNFNFKKAYQLLQRLSGKVDIDPKGYEHLLLSRITDTQNVLLTADSQIKSVIQKLRKSIDQPEDLSKTINVPPLAEQIKVINELIEGFEREVAWIDAKKEELEKRLQGKAYGSQERIIAYDYVLGGHDWEAERKKLEKQERERTLDQSWAPGSGPLDDYY
ncbi:hypothetical protein DID88_001038 [Monilinia fructigena]|uniref:Uncharacterized protein n=1 Tax=Monilinia fructigena TaxID=38457 RepID=A0A395IZ01_9HELO|nr:hypothetical protein DID88_001038 [Monilinia fructigena]